ncbi:MAG: Do family serine endopeptidase [Pyrinomonadaceae bacterium]
MKKGLFLFVLVMTGLAAASCRSSFFGGDMPPAPAAPPPPPVSVDGIRTSYADVVERTSPAVVRITAESRSSANPHQFPFGGDDFFRQFPIPRAEPPGPQLQRGLGSGVLVSADGTILTNNHVVEGAQKITVQMSDDKTFEAKIVGSDKPSDLAVLKIEAQNLPFLNLGNSDTVRVGDIVLAIGNPLGIGQTVTAGIISAKGRRTGLSDGTSFQDFLQTDAPINRGNSGGALVNLNGELIGINSQILSPGGPNGGNIGIGFAIPSNMAKSVLEQLLANGRVRRGMLGVNIQDLTADTAKALGMPDTVGVLVSNVKGGSAADKAGIKRRDVIVAVNGEKIEDSNALRNKIANSAPGSEVKLRIVRDGKEQELTATLDELDSDVAQNAGPGDNGQVPGDGGQNGKLGLGLQPLTPQTARQLGLSDADGMVVTEVSPSGAAAEAGIERGDVLLEVNGRSVKTADDVRAALDAGAGRPALLLISRRGQTIYVTVTPQ